MKKRDVGRTEDKMRSRLEAIPTDVILRTDFEDLGSYQQISRILKKLIDEKKLVRISNGIYAKAFVSKYSDIPLIQNSTDSALRKAFDRLRIAYECGSAEREYNEGKTTQVPARNIVILKDRCRRRIGYGRSKLIFEGGLNAK